MAEHLRAHHLTRCSCGRAEGYQGALMKDSGIRVILLSNIWAIEETRKVPQDFVGQVVMPKGPSALNCSQERPAQDGLMLCLEFVAQPNFPRKYLDDLLFQEDRLGKGIAPSSGSTQSGAASLPYLAGEE
nr:hypothetical protein CFP56_31738 [Quercus suber]